MIKPHFVGTDARTRVSMLRSRVFQENWLHEKKFKEFYTGFQNIFKIIVAFGFEIFRYFIIIIIIIDINRYLYLF